MISSDVHNVSNITLDEPSELSNIGTYVRHIRIDVGENQQFNISLYADQEENLRINIRKNEIVSI